VFDILAPDLETSLLPGNMKLVLHVNPTTMSFSYTKQIERIQTKGGYVEQHWGEGPGTMALTMATGGFMRLFSGLSNITGGPFAKDMGGSRRETIAYDKYLDMLAMFHSNGAIYDLEGNIAFQGILKVTFDEGVHLGWFTSFSVQESAQKPYQFELSGDFQVHKEIMSFKSTVLPVEAMASRFDSPDPSKMPDAVLASNSMGEGIRLIIPENTIGDGSISIQKAEAEAVLAAKASGIIKAAGIAPKSSSKQKNKSSKGVKSVDPIKARRNALDEAASKNQGFKADG
jgi:hypothetical protein